MGDRVPISTIPGLVSPWVGETLTLIPTGSDFTVSNVFLVRNGNQAGDALNVRFSNGSTNVDVPVADGSTTATTDIALEVSSSQTLTMEVLNTGDTNSENLRGWFEITGGTAVTTLLTSLVRLKRFLGITGSDDDTLLNELISSVSDEIQVWLGLRILLTTSTDEPVDSIGTETLALDQFPIVSFSSLTENGTALVEGTDYESTALDKNAGLIVRLASGERGGIWAKGRRIVRITYIHGYGTVPEGVQQAATELAAYDYFASKPGGKRLGITDKVLDTGGSSTYRSRDEVWDALSRRLTAYRRAG